MLAMVVNDAACLLTKRSALESIASKLAPTESLTERHYAFEAPFFLPEVFHRHLAGSPTEAQVHVPLFKQFARVINHLRIAAQHDP